MKINLVIWSILMMSWGLKAQLPDLTVGIGEVYGTNCGFVGSPPPSRLIIEQYIKDNSTNAISAWLESPSLVKKVYAGEAILRLQKEGVIFSEDALDQLDALMISEESIATCSGCIYSQMRIDHIFKDLKQR